MQSTKKTSVKEESNSAIALLMEDHARVRALFAEFKKIKDNASAQTQKTELVRQVCQELLVHAQVEEEIFYPAVRAAIDDEDLMDEAAVEHAGAKDLIRQLLEMTPGEELYDAKVTVLSESIEHHVGEEEGSMFPQARRAKGLEPSLGDQLQQRKLELLAQLELPKAKKSVRTGAASKSQDAPAAAR